MGLDTPVLLVIKDSDGQVGKYFCDNRGPIKKRLRSIKEWLMLQSIMGDKIVCIKQIKIFYIKQIFSLEMCFTLKQLSNILHI